MPAWPDWWNWNLEFTSHVYQRMIDRNFDEIDLRLMLELAEEYEPNREPGRWMINTMHAGEAWKVIVEPDRDEELLVVVTAFPVE